MRDVRRKFSGGFRIRDSTLRVIYEKWELKIIRVNEVLNNSM